MYANTWLSDWSADVDNVLPHKRDMYLGVYGAMGILQTVFQFFTAIAMAIGCLNAARDIHDNLLQQTLRLPMSFFDTTPLGRIVNRFAKDMDIVDTMIPMLMRMAISMIFSVSYSIFISFREKDSFRYVTFHFTFQVLAVLVVISISTPIFMVVIIPLSIIYYFIQSFYIATSRQLKRIESVTRSPVYSHFGETITGQSTIRAYEAQTR